MPRQLTFSIFKRLLFLWGVLWSIVTTIFSATGTVLWLAVSNKPEHFRLWSRIWGFSTAWGIGIRPRARFEEELDPHRAYVFAINHQVALDVPAVGCVIPAPFGWVAKAELARIPFLGRSIKSSPSVFIDRSHPKKSIESIRTAGERIRSGTSVAIFPEGSRGHNGELRPFKKGAFLLAIEAGVPVVPVTILNGHQVFNEKTKLARPGVMHVVFSRPIVISGWTRADIGRLREEVRQRMQAQLDEWNRNDQGSVA